MSVLSSGKHLEDNQIWECGDHMQSLVVMQDQGSLKLTRDKTS